MAFKFYIDGFLTDQPDNDMWLTTTIKRNQEIGGFLTTQEVTLAYSNNEQLANGTISGYQYLKDLFDSGTCNQSIITIWDEQSATTTYRVYTGVIKVPTIQVKEQPVQLTCKIEDNSYYSYVNNNKNVAFSLYATKTKNGQIIVPPPIYDVDFYDSHTGVYGSSIGEYCRGYRIYDILRFLIPAISDNKVTFESDFLRLQSPHLFLFDGSALTNKNTDPSITTSFFDLTKELFRLKNLAFYVDQTDPDAPVLRIEDQAWFYAGLSPLVFTEPFDILTSIKVEKIFGTIKVGSTYNPGAASLGSVIYTWNKNQSYYGWKEEVYTPYGQCNTDTELNLVNDYYISSNAINDQVNGATSTNLDSLFIVECTGLDTVAHNAFASSYTFPSAVGPDYFYNMGINNVSKLQSHGTNFQSALTNTQNAGTDIFRAELGQDLTVINFNNPGTGNPSIVDPVPFADELSPDTYDPGNNYDSVTNFWYLVNTAGDYSFASTIILELQNSLIIEQGAIVQIVSPFALVQTQVALGVEFLVDIIAYEDSSLAVILFQSVGSIVTYTDGTYNVSSALVAQLPVGAVVRVTAIGTKKQFAPLLYGLTPLDQLDWEIVGLFATPPNGQDIIGIALEDSHFECNGTPEGALVPAQSNQTGFKVRVHEFEYPLTTAEFRQIVAFPIGMFEFIKDGVSRFGWIEELIHQHQSGLTRIKLITQDATT